MPKIESQGKGQSVAGVLAAYLALMFGAFAICAFAVAGVAWLITKYTELGNEIILPILLVFGVVTLLVALGALVGILANFELTTPGSALGLPEGSVQAVIALILVLIFAITAVFLATIDIGGPNGEVSERFATQILTTTGTLAVAVAGFYFGTRAVETGAAAAGVAAAPAATVRILSPASPVTLARAAGTKLPIAVATAPKDTALKWTVQGDDEESLVCLRPGDFEYRRGQSPSDEVILRFEIASDPTKSDELKVVA